MSNSRSSKQKEYDWVTIALFFTYTVGTPLVIVASIQGASIFACFLVSLFLTNASFTLWHEACHSNISSNRYLNTIIGVVSSFLSVYPGYFARRREHLAHHKYEGNEALDPVYHRVQCGPILFVFRLFFQLKRTKKIKDISFLPITFTQSLVDQTVVLFSIGIILTLLYLGHFTETFFTILLPRLIVFIAHAYYICYMPHASSGGGFEKYRIVSYSKIFYWLTFGQSMHGIHHLSPGIRWHQYSYKVEGFKGKLSNG